MCAFTIFMIPNLQTYQIMKRVAILDLGTNTFNLIIAEGTEKLAFQILVNHKLPVKLGEGKINDGEIIPSAFTRGVEAIDKQYQTILNYKVDTIKAFGTSALRSASNGQKFLDEIYNRTNLTVELISGDREAELIYYGVKQTLDSVPDKFLILDIGGGSNELIIADKSKIYWKKSYPLGIARLLEQFKPSNPISENQILEINKYLSVQLTDLFEELKTHNINTIVGASGSFETFILMINMLDKLDDLNHPVDQSIDIALKDFELLHQKLVNSTVEERRKMKGLESMRIEMIVLASLFVKFILENHNFRQLLQSNFALKEGAIFEILKETI